MYIYSAGRKRRKKLDHITKKRIGKTLLRFLDSPLDYAESLTDSSLGAYRFRIGDYRVVFDIESKDIVVLRIGHG
ncbi:MAG: type II toxin-antitoxin system mRNA interferase toxin, RelE/StbE family [Syntrophus sp. (in: bacteria)]|nr:type II toxin-antitoxin system mRNA interferase toxin, RelE/StbE family [Syntrophus sp. (in: bacteria)]